METRGGYLHSHPYGYPGGSKRNYLLCKMKHTSPTEALVYRATSNAVSACRRQQLVGN